MILSIFMFVKDEVLGMIRQISSYIFAVNLVDERHEFNWGSKGDG